MSRYTSRRSYEWSAAIAYLAGLFASDGCLANNGRHLIMTSKDYELIAYTQEILETYTKVQTKIGQFNTQAYHFQFSNVALYDFFLAAGITPAKSKTIQSVTVPNNFYIDFLRGYFDGDGTVYGFQDHRWRNSFMYYCGFVSASPVFLSWLQSANQQLLGTTAGSIHRNNQAQTLLYAKKDSRVLFSAMYASCGTPRLTRKYEAFKHFIESDPHVRIT